MFAINNIKFQSEYALRLFTAGNNPAQTITATAVEQDVIKSGYCDRQSLLSLSFDFHWINDCTGTPDITLALNNYNVLGYLSVCYVLLYFVDYAASD